MRIKLLVLVFSILFYITGCDRSYYFKNTRTTALTAENIDGLKLHDNIYESKFIEKYGKQTKPSQDNEFYDYYRLRDDLEIATVKEGKQKGDIVRITIQYEDYDMKQSDAHTEKGIKLGSTKEEVLSSYGENYYVRNEQGANIIGYIDTKMQVTLEFWLDDKEQVALIRFDDADVQ
ncbi:hypothetical protein [Bacillus cereus]|uniref:hypothetical protein n=1 Tax=Bacillus cereus TaxID=1396 RepID=UPI0001A0B5DB|nr:hypothetical protein bcere0022_14460 [Bacillus cereus Rock3-44]